jgi:N-sulfoglucosamine sulfohydrolase
MTKLATILSLLACSTLWSQPPNVLLITSEDNGPDLGCYGDPYAQTPNLDRLAAEGVRFERAFVTTASCSESRASILTGLYGHQSGQIGLASHHYRMFGNTPNIASLLKGHGYRTGIIGKLHVNPAAAFPFDYNPNSRAYNSFSDRDVTKVAASAEKFITASKAPFFLMVNYADAHLPFLRQQNGLPEKPLEPDEVRPLPWIGLDTPPLRQASADYYNCMSRLDTGIGLLLETLERTGVAENTLLIYLGDHGAQFPRGKLASYESSLRIPLIIRHPDHSQSDLVRTELVSTVDLLPTILAATGAPPHTDLPGRSLLPLLSGKEKTPWRRYLHSEYHGHYPPIYFPQRTLRDDRYKLIVNLLQDRPNPIAESFTSMRQISYVSKTDLAAAPAYVRRAYATLSESPPVELYDLREDPHEWSNLADDPELAEVKTRLLEQLKVWQQETRDPLTDPANLARLTAEHDAIPLPYKKPAKNLFTYPDYLATKSSTAAATELADGFARKILSGGPITYTELTSKGIAATSPGTIATIDHGGLAFTGAGNETGRIAIHGFDSANLTVTLRAEFHNRKSSVVYGGKTPDRPRHSLGLILRAPHHTTFGNGTAENPATGMVVVEILNNGGLLVRERNSSGRLEFLSSKHTNPLTRDALYAYRKGALETSHNGLPFDVDNDGVLEAGEPFTLTVILEGRSIAVCINDDPIYVGTLKHHAGSEANQVSLLKGRPGRFSNASTLWIDELQLNTAAEVPEVEDPVDEAPPDAPKLTLESVAMIWDRGEHQAFTDLIRYQDQWVCAFREAPKHDGGIRGSKIIILTSPDAETWTLAHAFSDPRGDVRDAKLAINPAGELVMMTAMQLFGAKSAIDRTYQTVALITTDPKNWPEPINVLDDGYWLWGLSWNNADGHGYSIGYRADYTAHLYRTSDGRSFERVVESLDSAANKPNESAFVFDGDKAYCLLRAFGPAYIGTAREPFTNWSWKRLTQPLGGPAMIQLPGGTLLGAGRRYLPDKVRTTSIVHVDPDRGRIYELLRLPSGGDTSYPGMVYHEGGIYMTYYSSHEGKSKIYFAKVAVSKE